jgi:hypothetical protein
MKGKPVSAILIFLAVSFAFADVLIEDFNDLYTGQTTLGQSLGTVAHSGYWYGFTDVKDGGSSTITPNVVSVDSQFALAVVAGGPDGSKCLHVTMNLTTKIGYPYAAIGFQINTTALPWIDLTAMTSFTFKAKGSGTMRVKFLTDKVTNGYATGSNWGDMGAEVTLTSAWQKFTITAADIKPQPYSPQATDNLTWAACKDKVGKIHFQTAPSMVSGSMELYLDSLVMTGVSAQAFGGTNQVIYHSPLQPQSPMTLSASGNKLTILLPSSQKITADLFSMNGSLVHPVFNGTMRKATFMLPVSNGNYIAKVSGKDGTIAVPLKVVK